MQSYMSTITSLRAYSSRANQFDYRLVTAGRYFYKEDTKRQFLGPNGSRKTMKVGLKDL